MIRAIAAVALAAIAGCGGASGRMLKIDIVGLNVVKPGDPVRVLGQQYGTVDEVKPVRLRSGQAGSVAMVTLEKQVGVVPVDSTVVIHRDSIELSLGNASQTIPNGGTLPASQTRVRLGP